MDNKITNERLKVALKYDWLKYVAVAVVAVFLSIFIFGWIGNVKSHEKIEIFIVCNEHYDDNLAADALEYLNENVENNKILEVNVTYISPSDSDYRDVYSANGGSGSSILILPQSEMELTGYMYPYFVDNGHYKDSSLTVEDCFSYAGNMLNLNEEMKDYYFSGNNWKNTMFRYEYTGDTPNEDEYLSGVANGCLYGFNISILKGGKNFKFYEYDGSSVKYHTNVLTGQPDYSDPYTEPGYLVINDANAYTVGELGNNKKYHDRTETFIVAKFILERYFYWTNK